MTRLNWALAAAAVSGLALSVAACKTDQAPAPATAGEVSAGGSTGGSAGSSIPTLVSVNLQNVLNDLSVSLNVNRNNIPVNAQVPIDVAANVCGVSVSALAASIANGQAGCTATTTTPQLTQLVQQQISTGGNVQGGDQTMGAPSGSTSTTNNVM